MELERATAQATSELAKFVAGTGYEDVPASVREHAKLIVADTIGVALRGSIEPEMRALYERLPAGRGARLLCAGFPETEPDAAAFANAVAILFLELDEGVRPTGHPAAHVLPACLAVAQSTETSGSDFLTAFVLGYEVQARIQSACTLRWPVHPHGNLGNAGAVAALGKLSSWDAAQICEGINAAASLTLATSWRSCLVGATVRNAWAGITARTAFAVKLLVESGFTAHDAALAETFGTLLADDFDPAALADGLGESFGLEQNYFKFHASCAVVHPVLDALADALGSAPQEGVYPPWPIPERPDADEIRRVRVRVNARGTKLAALHLPNQLSAKFSIPYAAAAFLVRGTTDPESFRGDLLTDSRVRELAERVEVVEAPPLTARWPKEAAAEVELDLSDGRQLAGACANPYGSGTRRPTRADLRAKFHALAGAVISPEEQSSIWGLVLGLDDLSSMARFPVGR